MSNILIYIPAISLALAVVIGILLGMKRGIFKNLFHLGIIIIRIILSFILTIILSNPVSNLFLKLLGKTLAESDLYALLDYQKFHASISVLSNMICSAILFLAIFIVVSIIMEPLEIVFAKLCKVPKAKNMTYRWCGGAVGILTALIVFNVMYAPITGLLHCSTNMLDDPISKLSDNQKKDMKAPITFYKDVIKPLDENKILSLNRNTGGTLLFDCITTKKYSYVSDTNSKSKKIKTNLKKESGNASKLLESAITLSNTDIKKINEKDIRSIRKIGDTLKESKLILGVTSDSVKYAYSKWASNNNNKSKSGIIDIDTIFRTFAESSDEDLINSIYSLADTLETMYKYDVLEIISDTDNKDYLDKLYNAMEDKEFADEFSKAVKEDKNLEKILRDEGKVIIVELIDKKSDSTTKDVEKVYDTIIVDITNTFNTTLGGTKKDKAVETLTDSLMNLAESNNVNAPEIIVNIVSEDIVNDFVDKKDNVRSNVSKEEVVNWVENYLGNKVSLENLK